jgi:hypothetical protein
MTFMTSKLFIVGSSIQTRSNRLTYSKVRTIFSREERLRQTIFTINSITNAFPDSKIVLVDSSDDTKDIEISFKYFKNVEFIALKELSGEAHEIVNTHKNKSLCESLLLNTYYTQYKKYIKEFDFVVKACGRYFYFDMLDSFFTEENKDKIFFKKPLKFKWNDTWNYQYIDARETQKDDFIRQYCTVLYGFGSSHLHKFIDMNEAIVHLISYPQMSHFDVETLSYYMTRPFQSQIIETDWRVCGWDGTSGKFMFY